MFWIYFIPLMSVAAVLLPYLIFYLGWPQQVAKLKIHAKTPGWGIMRREIAYSALSVVVFALVGWGLDGLVQAGYTQLFEKISVWGWLYLPLALSLAFLLHDAYFYWSHRLMHWGWLYRVAHCWHHRFHTPISGKIVQIMAAVGKVYLNVEMTRSLLSLGCTLTHPEP